MPSISEETNSLSLVRPRRNKQLDGTYYHVSFDPTLGNTVQFFPRLPEEACISELNVSRICFAPSISQCLMAICHKEFNGDTFFIYKSDIEVFIPVGVNDSEITKEVWALNPVWLYKVESISKKTFFKDGWYQLKDLLKEYYLACWSVSGFDSKKGFIYFEEIRNFLNEHKINDHP